MARIIDGVLVADEDEVLGWLAHAKPRKTAKQAKSNAKRAANTKAKAKAYLDAKLSKPTGDSKGLIADRDGIRGKGDGPGSPDSGSPVGEKGGRATVRESVSAPVRARLDAIEKKYPPVNPNGPDTLARQQDEEGDFHGERQALHEKFVSETLNKATPVTEPEFVMLGGGPAAGKSKILGAGVEIDSNSITVNADDCKEVIPEYKVLKDAGDARSAAYVHEESSYLAKEILRKSLSESKNTVLDGTGNSAYKSVVNKVQRARAAGHTIRAEYVTCKTETALARAAKRDRPVPEAVVRSTHRSVSQVVPKALKDGLFDTFNLWNTEVSGPPVKVASAVGKQVTIHDQTLWQEFLDKGK